MQLFNIYLKSGMQYMGSVKAKNFRDAIKKYKQLYWMPGDYIAKLA